MPKKKIKTKTEAIQCACECGREIPLNLLPSAVRMNSLKRGTVYYLLDHEPGGSLLGDFVLGDIVTVRYSRRVNDNGALQKIKPYLYATGQVVDADGDGSFIFCRFYDGVGEEFEKRFSRNDSYEWWDAEEIQPVEMERADGKEVTQYLRLRSEAKKEK